MTVPARNEVAKIGPAQLPSATAIESVLIKGDLSKLNEQQRTEYYMRLCSSIGLNPMTQPFQYLTLNGKLVLYARRDCADQLRKINGISIEIVSQDKADGLLSIHVRAKDRDGRADEDLGVVSFPESLNGDNAANAILKAVTKAKRRVTLSLSGLGFLDETEVSDIPQESKRQNLIEYDEQGQVERTSFSLSAEQVDNLKSLIVEVGADIPRFCKYMRVERIEDIPAAEFKSAVEALNSKRKQVQQ